MKWKPSKTSRYISYTPSVPEKMSQCIFYENPLDLLLTQPRSSFSSPSSRVSTDGGSSRDVHRRSYPGRLLRHLPSRLPPAPSLLAALLRLHQPDSNAEGRSRERIPFCVSTLQSARLAGSGDGAQAGEEAATLIREQRSGRDGREAGHGGGVAERLASIIRAYTSSSIWWELDVDALGEAELPEFAMALDVLRADVLRRLDKLAKAPKPPQRQ